MKYFIELVESYLRIHEQASGQASAEINKTAQKLITDAESASGTPITVKGNITLRRSKNGNITLYGYGTINYTVKNGNGTINQKEYDILLKLLSGEISGEKKGKSKKSFDMHSNSLNPPTQEIGWNASKMFEKLGLVRDPKGKVRTRRNVEKSLLWSMMQNMFPAGHNIKDELPAIIRRLRIMFGGTTEAGSLADMISKHTTLVIDENGKSKITLDSNPVIVENTNSIIEKMIVRISNLNSNGEKLSPEECKKFQEQIVPIRGKRIYIKDRASNTGVVINDTKENLYEIFDAQLKSVGCGLGERKSIGSIRGAAAQIRGALYESAQKLLTDLVNCITSKSKSKGECSDEIGRMFETEFKDKKDLLAQALQAYKKVEDSGSIPIDGDAPESLVFSILNNMLGDKVATKILMAVANSVAQAYNIRKPDLIVRVADVVGFGRKGDQLELWKNREDYITAMAKMGIDRKTALDSVVMHTDEEGNTYFGADVSLKSYIELSEGVGLGSVSENTLKSIFNGANCIAKGLCKREDYQQIVELRKGMATFFGEPWMTNDGDPRFVAVSNIQSQIDSAEQAIDNLEVEAVVASKDGTKTINVKPLETLCENLRSALGDQFSFQEIQESGLMDALNKYLEKPTENPAQLKALLKNFFQAKIMKNNLSNPNTKQAALDMLAMSEFAAGGSRNQTTLISMAGIIDQEIAVCKQNDLFDAVRRSQKQEAGYTVEINLDGNKTTYYGPPTEPGGEPEVLYSAEVSSSTTGTRRRESNVSKSQIDASKVN